MTKRSTYTIPMHQDHVLITLQQIVRVVGGQPLAWQLTELEAISFPDSHLDVLSLEELVTTTPGGVRFTTQELSELAESLHQIVNCELIGFCTNENGDEVAVVTLNATDSTRWDLSVDESSVTVDRNSDLFRPSS